MHVFQYTFQFVVHFCTVQPVISVEMADQNHEVHVTVYSPQRMMHHPKFKLQSYKFSVAVDNGQTTDLGTSNAEFREDSTSHVFTLPPQAHKMAGKLRVMAVYGGGVEVSSGPIKVEFPCYGKCMHTWGVELVLASHSFHGSWLSCSISSEVNGGKRTELKLITLYLTSFLKVSHALLWGGGFLVISLSGHYWKSHRPPPEAIIESL